MRLRCCRSSSLHSTTFRLVNVRSSSCATSRGLSNEDACAALGITSGNQRILLHRGRSRMRQILESKWRRADRCRHCADGTSFVSKPSNSSPTTWKGRCPAGIDADSKLTFGPAPTARPMWNRSSGPSNCPVQWRRKSSPPRRARTWSSSTGVGETSRDAPLSSNPRGSSGPARVG